MNAGSKEDVMYTKVIFNPDSLSEDEGTEIHLDDLRMMQASADETLAPDKGQGFDFTYPIPPEFSAEILIKNPFDSNIFSKQGF
jgi:hypothetical protein